MTEKQSDLLWAWAFIGVMLVQAVVNIASVVRHW